MVFYELRVGRARRFVEGASLNDWESIRCPKDPGHQRAGRRLTDLFLDVLSWTVVDFSRTMLSDIVIADHALDVLRDAGLTGYAVQSTRIERFPAGVDAPVLPRLWEFIVTGKGGPAHKSSGIRQIRKCEACGLVRYSAYENGIIVDESAHDGSDFLTVAEYPKHILVSQRAKFVIETNRLTNVSLVDSSEIEWPGGVTKPI